MPLLRTQKDTIYNPKILYSYLNEPCTKTKFFLFLSMLLAISTYRILSSDGRLRLQFYQLNILVNVTKLYHQLCNTIYFHTASAYRRFADTIHK